MCSSVHGTWARVVAFVLFAPTTLNAEEVFERIDPGAQVRITAPNVATCRFIGTVASVDSGGIELIPRERDVARGCFIIEKAQVNPSMPVPWTAVTGLELGQKKWAGKRTIKGAGIGLLAGAVLSGFLLLATMDDYYGSITAFWGGLILSGSGLVLGATIGALPHEQWEKVLPTQERFR